MDDFSSKFFLFEGLWRKFFGVLVAWIRRVSPICSFLKFMEAFELDSSDLWDLERWFKWFLFECSLYSKLRFLKFLEASRLDSNRDSVLLNLLWFCLCSRYLDVFQDLSQDVLVCWNALGMLLFIGDWGWVSDTWQSLIGDMSHSLIGGALTLFLQDTWHLLIGQNVLIFKVTYVSTRLDCLCRYLHVTGYLCHSLYVLMYNWFLHTFYVFISMTLDKFLLISE